MNSRDLNSRTFTDIHESKPSTASNGAAGALFCLEAAGLAEALPLHDLAM